jgi:hypothetical protein
VRGSIEKSQLTVKVKSSHHFERNYDEDDNYDDDDEQ